MISREAFGDSQGQMVDMYEYEKLGVLGRVGI